MLNCFLVYKYSNSDAVSHTEMNSFHRNYQKLPQNRLKTGNADCFVKLYIPKDLISFCSNFFNTMS